MSHKEIILQVRSRCQSSHNFANDLPVKQDTQGCIGTVTVSRVEKRKTEQVRRKSICTEKSRETVRFIKINGEY